MKTLGELCNEGNISTRLYNAMIRGVGVTEGFHSYFYKHFDELEPIDILNKFSIDTIMRWRCLGQKSFLELLSLCENTKECEGCKESFYLPFDKYFICRKTGQPCKYEIPNIDKCISDAEKWESINFVEYLEQVCGIYLSEEQEYFVRELEKHKMKKIMYNEAEKQVNFV